MIYIETGSDDVYYNFGLEYYFTVERILDDTVFLFWRTSPTLMVGKYQNVLEEINKPYADEHGIKLVRRMSGGGTIYTDPGGWQFTFIQHENADEIHFSRYITPVIDALAEIGIKAEFNGRNDLVIDGRKFSGNAQYRLGGNIVHHGSLLFDTNIEQMVASTTVDKYKILSKSIKSVRDRVTNISEHLTSPMSADEFKEIMVRHIGGPDMKTYELTFEDKTRISELAAEKFGNWEAIFGADPKFNIERENRFAGGKISFKIDVKKGRIADIAVYGDFFAAMESSAIKDALTGCKYEKGAVRDALIKAHLESAIYRITLDEIVDTIVD